MSHVCLGVILPRKTHHTYFSLPAMTHTCAPACSNATVIASPMPRLPPVTRAFLPFNKSGTNGRTASCGPRPIIISAAVSGAPSCAAAAGTPADEPPRHERILSAVARIIKAGACDGNRHCITKGSRTGVSNNMRIVVRVARLEAWQSTTFATL